MKGFTTFLAGAAVFAASAVSANPSPVVNKRASSTSALPTVTASGNAFYAGSDRFYIRGLAYQPGGSSEASDPLANEAGCKRDIPEFQKLGLNTIRVYTVDNTADHDYCMNALAAAGIYVALDVNTPNYSLNRDDPAPSYNADYLQSLFATVDVFAQYSNTLLFFSGNEVINTPDNSDCAPYVKAVTRDLKQYRTSRGYRAIPIGYSAADVSENVNIMAEYMNCGTADQRSDFYAFNDYTWCAPSTFETSGWSVAVDTFSNYSIPMFYSEYGCIKPSRDFEEVPAMYNTEMTKVFSGGLVYEYSEEGNNYGIVTINGNSVSENNQFGDLQKQLAATSNPSGNGGATSSNQPASCPAAGPNWDVSKFPGESLPAIPSGAVQYMSKGAGKGPGLTGDGSQNAGGASSGTATAGSGVATSTATPSGGSSTSTSSHGAASGLRVPEMSSAPFIMTAIVLCSTLLGATLL